MYEDMYKDYSDESFKYSYPISFECRNKAYMYLNDPIRASWYYGDEVPMTFDLCDKDAYDEQDLYDYLNDKTIRITFYNFRKEIVNEVDFYINDVQADEVHYYIYYDIDSETSAKIFTRGIYYCGMTLIDENNNVETLLYYQHCTIEVK